MRFEFLLAALVVSLGWLSSFTTIDAGTGTVAGRIVRHDPRFDALIPKDAALEVVADGFHWVEGPVWHREGRYLLFSDIPNNAVMKWEPGKGASIFLKPAGYSGSAPFTGPEPGSNGLVFDREGRLILCEHGDRRITRLDAGHTKTVLADRYMGKRLNSPNDVIVASNGDLYFTDPPFGLPGGMNDPGRELDFNGVYRVATDGTVTLLTREVGFPNGIALSPSETTLYVSNADRSHAVWMAFDLRPDRTVGPGRIIHDGTEWAKTRKGVPDGMDIDVSGNLFGAGPEGIYVFAPDGTLLGSIETGVPTGNCAWGDDGSVLYITANTTVYRIRTTTRGF